MKKLFSCVLVFVLTLSLLSVSGTASAEEAAAAPKKRIVTTIFPIYDWVMNVLGEQAENAEVSMLLDNGVDLHSYQPTADDIVRISGCDLFIYVGGESDEWVRDALQEATNKNMTVINLMGWSMTTSMRRKRITTMRKSMIMSMKRITITTQRRKKPNTTSTSGSR